MKEIKGPHIVEAKVGTITLCTCGLSSNLPHCDGSHKTTENKPYIHTVEKDSTVYVCACGRSKNPPFCDGSHNNETK